MAEKEYSSRFSDILNTNHIATGEESAEIQALLVEPKEELAQLDEEIASLKSKLKGLKARRGTVGEFVNSHAALVSPFRRLPDDALVEIFLRCVPTDRNPTRSMAEPPLLLTRINRRCREIALSTPGLWHALHIFLPPFDEQYESESKSRIKKRTEGVQAWLDRSGSLPLNLSVVMGRFKDNRNQLYKPLMRTLASVSSRWRRLEISAPMSFMRSLEKDVDKGNLTSLKTLKMDYGKQNLSHPDGFQLFHNHQTQSTPQLGFSDILTNATEIRSLALHGYTSDVLAFPVAWDSLTKLVLHSRYTRQTAEELLVVLRKAAPSLQSCDVSVYCPPPPAQGTGTDAPSAHTYISFPRLHTLKVSVILHSRHNWQMGMPPPPPQPQQPTLASLDVFFATIVAPSLNSFLFAADIAPGVGFYERLPFVSMITKSECQIETFRLSFPVTQAGLADCLRLLPFLRTLDYNECLWGLSIPGMNGMNHPPSQSALNQLRQDACAITDTLFDLLTPSPENPEPICPRLRAMLATGVLVVKEKAVLRFAQSRSPSQIRSAEAADEPRAVSPLKQLLISYDRDIELKGKKHGNIRDSPLYSRIQKLKTEEGVDVKLSYLPRISHIGDSPWAGQHDDNGMSTFGGDGFMEMTAGVAHPDMDDLMVDTDDDDDDDDGPGPGHGQGHHHGHGHGHAGHVGGGAVFDMGNHFGHPVLHGLQNLAIGGGGVGIPLNVFMG